MTSEATLDELRTLKRRIETTDARQDGFRARQRALIRELIADGKTWDDAQRLAGVSRTTVQRAVHEKP